MKAALIVLLLTGCATVWNHQTKTAEDFHRDAYECERDSAMVTDGIQAYGMRRRCMQVKGWRE